MTEPKVLEHKSFPNGDHFVYAENESGDRVWRFMAIDFIYQEFADLSFKDMTDFINRMETLRIIDHNYIPPLTMKDNIKKIRAVLHLPEELFDI